jgi:Family of unknown function (DUF6232)
MREEFLFEANDVRITPHVAFIGGTSYQISTIESVHGSQRKKWNRVAVAVFFLGLGVLATAVVAARTTGSAEDYFSIAVIGVSVMVAAFFFQLVWPRRLYALVLRTSSGDLDALTSRKREFVSDVKQALEQAFCVRAGQLTPPAESGSEAAIQAVFDVAASAARATLPRG